MGIVLELLGLKLSEKQQQMKALVNNSYNTVRVVGRGTVKIDAAEVIKSQGYIDACKKVEQLFKKIP